MKSIPQQMVGAKPGHKSPRPIRLSTFSGNQPASSLDKALFGLRHCPTGFTEESPCSQTASLKSGSLRVPRTLATPGYLKALREAELAEWKGARPTESAPGMSCPGQLVRIATDATRLDWHERWLYRLLGAVVAIALGYGGLCTATSINGLVELARFVNRLLGAS